MARLSNIFRGSDPESSGGAKLVCRHVVPHEIEPALRLLLEKPQMIAPFRAVADQRAIDLNKIWLLESNGRMIWMALPVFSPGKSALLLVPEKASDKLAIPAAKIFYDHVCAETTADGIELVQVLLDPKSQQAADVHEACGFERLATLIYLEAQIVDPPADLSIETETYSPATHDDFAKAIVASYEASLDCPSLNGRRDIQDVIAGHRASGVFDPSAWHLLRVDGQPAGVLLLNGSIEAGAVELVYIGLAAAARGKGLGDALLRLARRETLRLGRQRLHLAVDDRNQPALGLYYRTGFRRIGSRLALARFAEGPAT